MSVVDSSAMFAIVMLDADATALAREPIAAPHLIDTEMLNAARRHVHLGTLTTLRASAGLDAFHALALTRYSAAPLWQRVWQLRHNLSAYDATYVALAEGLGTSLLTADARLVNAPGIGCDIELI